MIELLGAHEIRLRMGGVSRQRNHQIMSRPSFPPPCAQLASGKVWAADDVDAWIAEYRPMQAPQDQR